MTNLTNQHHDSFSDIVEIINLSKERAYQAVNSALIELYWKIGEYISHKINNAEWGDGIVAQLADFIARTQPGLRGFTRSNLFRMRKFYEAYYDNQIVAPLVRQLSWTNNLIILNQGKTLEEREFYIKQSLQERWSKRELERQFKLALFERAVLNPIKTSKAMKETYPEVESVFKDAYVVEFLDLPDGHSELDLHHALLTELKKFLIELGRDFCFVGSEYPVQVGGRDFALDLLFFHRGLNCLIAFELLCGTSHKSSYVAPSVMCC